MGDVPRTLSRFFSIGGSVVVLAGLLVSLIRRRFASGLALLALGVVIAGLASEAIRAGYVPAFCAGLVVAIVVMYAGFLRSRA